MQNKKGLTCMKFKPQCPKGKKENESLFFRELIEIFWGEITWYLCFPISPVCVEGQREGEGKRLHQPGHVWIQMWIQMWGRVAGLYSLLTPQLSPRIEATISICATEYISTLVCSTVSITQCLINNSKCGFAKHPQRLANKLLELDFR